VSAFYMDVNLVTYTQWMAVYVFATNVGYNFQYPGSAKGTNHPVENLDWYNAVKWCNARSVQVGLPPVYYTDAGLSHVYTNGQAAPFVNWAAKGFRLPTEAEWEKAARGGAVGQRFPMGNTISETNANYFGEPGSFSYDLGPYGYNTPYDTTPFPYTNPAGSFPTNGYGLSDMAGNLEEWCWDWYGTPYGQPTATDPTGPATGLYRVLRGGYWNSYASSLRCAARSDSVAGNANDITGFRCVRRP
jgi:formylglycine-generating enzyme required for sulfatase activity